ncbi:MAG: thioether cross-link-forming SCIFF peptide maturase [Bacillota bacterium]|nr:thioether cross-link-forming SCIFF peptide maturase [Bacillota bacterium]
MVHLFQKSNSYFAIDVYSGAVHLLDALAYRLIEYRLTNAGDFQSPVSSFPNGKTVQIENLKQKPFEKQAKSSLDEVIAEYGPDFVEALRKEYSAEQIVEACVEIDQLIAQAQLFTENPYPNLKPEPPEKPLIKALCLHVAHDCNLKCAYCFASQGDFAGTKCMMSREVAKKALDFLIANSGKRGILEVDLFGGEPLMNWPLVKWIAGYVKELEANSGKKINLTITTNGVLLNEEKAKFINENFYNAVLSLDGRREVNDAMRKRLDNGGSYDLILPNFQNFVKNRKGASYYLRGTFTRFNLDFDKDVIDIAGKGFREISVEPVVSDKGMPYSLREEDLPKIMEAYDRLADKMCENLGKEDAFNFFHYAMDMENGPCLLKLISGCGAGSEYFSVTPEGDVYPCHQFVGQEEFKLGNLLQGLEEVPFRRDFFDCNVLSKPDCTDCWAKYYCSGGCHANAYSQNGDIQKPYKLGCEMEKKRIENSIYLRYQSMRYQYEKKQSAD